MQHKMDIEFSLFIFRSCWILHATILVVQFITIESSNCPTFFDNSDKTDKEIKVMESDLQTCDLFHDLINTMEKLHILAARDTSCFTLQRIIQTYDIKDPTSNSQTLQISFQFLENVKQPVTSGKNKKDFMCKRSTDVYNSSSYGIQSESLVHAMNGMNGNDSLKGNNSIFMAKPRTTDDDSSGLSQTQVVVIATCSAVIGTLFILAAALRIRNYVKRLREEQQTSRRSNNYRLPLTKGSNSLERNSRKSSSTSRNSQQNSLLDKDGNSNHNSNSPRACRQPLLDTTPRLIVTAPSTAASTPRNSRSSIQFIDEDGQDIKNKDEGNKKTETSYSASDIEKNNGPKTAENTADGIDNNLPEAVNGNDTINKNEEDRCINSEISCELPKEDSTVPDTSMSEMQSISIGLTQSDDSISSHNASYCYGNQVEYAANGGYGNFGYCPPTEDGENNGDHDDVNGYEHNEQNSPPTVENNFSKRFIDNDNATSFERDEMKSAINDIINSGNESLKNSHNVVSLDQYEQRRKLQRQDRTFTQTTSFETDAF